MEFSLYKFWPDLLKKNGRHRQFLFLIGCVLKKISKTAWPNEEKFGSKYLWYLLYDDSSFGPNALTNMVATGHSFF